MMTLFPTSGFKKDLKRIGKRGYDTEQLKNIIRILQRQNGKLTNVTCDMIYNKCRHIIDNWEYAIK